VRRAREEEDRKYRERRTAERAAAAAARHAAAVREADRVKALKRQPPKTLSPLLVEERRKALEREAKREAARVLRRAKQLERELAAEARERQLMHAEEWQQERVKWARNYGGGNGRTSTVRVFISSTFQDMHGERDSLTRSVFPALNNRAKPRRVRVVPIDLRWGLTAEDTSDSGLGALEHCLLEGVGRGMWQMRGARLPALRLQPDSLRACLQWTTAAPCSSCWRGSGTAGVRLPTASATGGSWTSRALFPAPPLRPHPRPVCSLGPLQARI